jgi:hypothetical protein
MNAEQIRQFSRATPFVPFVLILTDGRKVLVRHPEFLSFSPGDRTLVVHQLDDSFELVDLLAVARLERTTGSTARSERRR